MTQESPAKIVTTRQVTLDDEHFELRVEQDQKGRLSAAAYRNQAPVMSKKLPDQHIAAPLRLPEGEGSKGDPTTPEGQRIVASLESNLEQTLRDYHTQNLLA